MVLDFLRRWRGKLHGYGGCGKCGGTWNYKRGHSLAYRFGSAMFPLCEECWKRTTIEEKKFYVKQTVDSWRKDFPNGKYNGQSFESILENAFKAIEWEERGVSSWHVFGSEPEVRRDGFIQYLVCQNRGCLWHKEDQRFYWDGEHWHIRKESIVELSNK